MSLVIKARLYPNGHDTQENLMAAVCVNKRFDEDDGEILVAGETYFVERGPHHRAVDITGFFPDNNRTWTDVQTLRNKLELWVIRLQNERPCLYEIFVTQG